MLLFQVQVTGGNPNFVFYFNQIMFLQIGRINHQCIRGYEFDSPSVIVKTSCTGNFGKMSSHGDTDLVVQGDTRVLVVFIRTYFTTTDPRYSIDVSALETPTPVPQW